MFTTINKTLLVLVVALSTSLSLVDAAPLPNPNPQAGSAYTGIGGSANGGTSNSGDNNNNFGYGGFGGLLGGAGGGLLDLNTLNCRFQQRRQRRVCGFWNRYRWVVLNPAPTSLPHPPTPIRSFVDSLLL